MTHKIGLTAEGIIEVEYFGITTYSDRARALDALELDVQRPDSKKILVNFVGANIVNGDDAERLDFLAKAVIHPSLEGSMVALVGLTRANAHPAETAGIIRQIQVRVFERRDDALSWLRGSDRQ